MRHSGKTTVLGGMLVVGLLCVSSRARADEAIVTVGPPPSVERFPERDPDPAPLARPSRVTADDGGFVAQDPELRRSPFRLTLGPAGITTGKSMGLGVGVGADFGSGSVGGRLSATWLRGEGKTASGSSTPTGDAVGQYTGEITLDLHKHGPVHPLFGMGAGFLHVSRSDGKSGFGGVGTGRFALEYALGFDDADVRAGASITGGVLGPIDSDVNDLRAYALAGAHLAIGF